MDKWLVKAAQLKTNENVIDDSGITATASKRSKISQSSSTIKKKCRKYQEGYIKYGFSYTIVNDEQYPLCVVCSEKLAQESMKPAKLKRHLETKHPELVDKSESYFKRHANCIQSQKTFMEKHTTVPQKALRASLEVSYLIGRNMKPHTIGESLVLPAAIKIISIMHGEKYSNDLKSIPLSRDTVSRRITAISDNIKSNLLDRLKNSKFYAIQLDETTDISNMAQLIVYVRYCYEGDILEDFLFCQALVERTTGGKIFEVLNNFFNSNKLSWSNCVAICTDGAAALTGEKKGLKGKIREIAPKIVFNHCMIHRETLVAKEMQEDLCQVLNEAVSVINFIKSRSLNSRLFTILCNEMGSAYETLLLHTEVRWLSRGRVLRRLFDLKDEVLLFLSDKNPNLSQFFVNEKWLARLSYLVDIFEKLNDLNLSLQGRETNILILNDKIDAFKRKLIFWKSEIELDNMEMFPCLSDFIKTNNIEFQQTKCIIIIHLTKLIANFSKRFEVFDKNEFGWVRDPFSYTIPLNSEISIQEKEQLIDISTDETLRVRFNISSCAKFWMSLQVEYPQLSEKALHTLLPFASTYLCEAGFSKLVAIKTKQRSRLNPEDDLRIALSNISPNIDQILSEAQAHPSH